MPLGLRDARARARTLASAAGLVFAMRSGRAGAAELELTWSAPSGCPSRQAIVDATQARLGVRQLDASPELVVVDGTVSPRDGGFVIALVLKDGSGHDVGVREVRVEADHCSAVEGPAALMLAIIVTTRSRAVPPDHPPEPEEGSPPALPAPPAPGRSAAMETSPSRANGRASAHRPRVSLGAAGTASLGLLPTAGLGAALRATYTPASLVVVGLQTTFELGSFVPTANGGVGFQFMGASALAGLQAMRTSRFELILTAAVGAGVVRTAPTGFGVVHTNANPTALAGPGVLIRTRLTPRLFAEVFPGIDVVLVRDRFQIRDGERREIHRPEPFAARLSLGLAYEFP